MQVFCAPQNLSFLTDNRTKDGSETTSYDNSTLNVAVYEPKDVVKSPLYLRI